MPGATVSSATAPGKAGPRLLLVRGPAAPGLAGYGLIEWLPEVAEGDFRLSVSAPFIPLPWRPGTASQWDHPVV
jgi:hypothetical protein